MFNIEELIEKWQELGFLEQMPENLKPNVVLKYELAAIFLMDNDGYLDNTILLNISFPLIYRIYKQGNTIPNVESFIRQLNMFIDTNRETIQYLNGFHRVDTEAEMCGLFAEQWNGNTVIKPLKWIRRHKLVG
ncbi:heat shock factor family protein [bacterium]|nr:heat shock factor family protein [bacterium]